MTPIAKIVESRRPEVPPRPEFHAHIEFSNGGWWPSSIYSTPYDPRPNIPTDIIRIPSEAECAWRKEREGIRDQRDRACADLLAALDRMGTNFEGHAKQIRFFQNQIVELTVQITDLDAAHPEWAKEE